MDLRLAIQLYTLRHADLTPDAMFARLADIGYRGVELAGTYDLEADALAELLERRGLRAVASHVALERLRDDLDEVLSYHSEIGCDTVVVPWLDASGLEDAGAWRAAGREIGQVAERCIGAGARLLYHNHDFEMVELDGRLALDWLLEGANEVAEDALGLELDLAWVKRGGRDPLALLERHGGRCALVHVKDVREEGEHGHEGGFADVGWGTMEWETLLPAATEAGAEWFVVEHDHPTNPMNSARASAEYLLDLAPTL